MAYRDLREFVRKLEKEGELTRVRTEVDPVLEITEITQRVARDGKRKANSVGPALLFEKPKGSRVPLLVNTFGSVRRMELAFEVGRLEEVADRIKGFLAMESPQGLFDKIKMLPKLAELGSFFPKSVKDGDCKEVVRTGADINLFHFPILKCWPQDGGRFITFPLVLTRNPETGKRNVGMYACKFTTSARPGCIGRRKSTARNISAARAQPIPMAAFLSPWPSAPTPPPPWPACCRFPQTSTK